MKLGITSYILLVLLFVTGIIYVYSFFAVTPEMKVNYTISQNTIFVKSDSKECYITFTVQNTGTIDFKIEAIVLNDKVISLPVEGMLGSLVVKVGSRAAYRIPLNDVECIPGTVMNLFLKTQPPLLEAQKFVVVPTPVEELG